MSQLLHAPSAAQVVLIAAPKFWKVSLKRLSEGRLERQGRQVEEYGNLKVNCLSRRNKPDENQHRLFPVEWLGAWQGGVI